MPRKGHVAKKDVLVDPIYNSKLVTRLINKIMLDGKKGVAQNILYNAFDIVEQKTGSQPMEVFEKALDNVMPELELKLRRVGGANYQVPVEVSDERRLTLGLRWIVNYARLRSERTMEQRLAAEIIDASNGIGQSVITQADNTEFRNNPRISDRTDSAERALHRIRTVKDFFRCHATGEAVQVFTLIVAGDQLLSAGACSLYDHHIAQEAVQFPQEGGRFFPVQPDLLEELEGRCTVMPKNDPEQFHQIAVSGKPHCLKHGIDRNSASG